MSNSLPSLTAIYRFPQSGWTVLVESLPNNSRSLDQAIADANVKRANGVGDVDVLNSDQYLPASLASGLWIEYLGPYATRAEGDAVCRSLHARGLADPGDNGCHTKENPLIAR